MKNLLVYFVCLSFLWACNETELVPAKQNTADLKNGDQVSPTDIPFFNPFIWIKLTVPQMNDYPFNSPGGRVKIVPVGDDVYCMIGGAYEVVYKLNKSTKKWALFTDTYGMSTPFAVGHQYLFSYGSKFYYGLRSEEGDFDYVAALDPVTGQRITVPRFPGVPVGDPMCFSIGTKGYIMGGVSYATGNPVNQLWEYDFILNRWTNKGSLAGSARIDGVAIAIGTKVYFGLGYDYITLGTQKIKRLKKDWYMTEPQSNSVVYVKSDFPGTLRSEMKGFTIEKDVYLGWGRAGTPGNISYLSDFWAYYPETNVWDERASCPATPEDDGNVDVFAFDNRGYLVKGWLAEFWRYML